MTSLSKSTCTVLLSSGERKNLPCGKKNSKGIDTCMYHMKKTQLIREKKIAVQVVPVSNKVETVQKLPPLSLINQMIPKQVTPLKIESVKKTKEKIQSDMCTFILLKGQRKGEQCGKKKCPTHKDKIPTNIKDLSTETLQTEPLATTTLPTVSVPTAPIAPIPTAPIAPIPTTCSYIFLKGVNKGERCGKKTCIHLKVSNQKKTEIKPIESSEIPIPVIVPSNKSNSQVESEKKVEMLFPFELPVTNEEIVIVPQEQHTVSQKDLFTEKPKQLEHIENQIAIQEEITCKQILKKGKRVGECCGKQVSKNGYCWFHRVQDPKEMDTDGYITSDEDNLPEPLEFCKIILTHGKYRGFRCGNMCVEGTPLCTFHHRVNY
jgi:hypothetical protein